MSIRDRLDRLERELGGDGGHHLCGDALPSCTRPDLPHDRFTFTIDIGTVEPHADEEPES